MKKLQDITYFEPDIILIDGLNVASIEFYAKRDLSFEGRSTGMLYGTCKKLKGLNSFGAKVIWLWDGPYSIRKKKYPFYKANRTYADRDNSYYESLSDVKVALNYMGVVQIEHRGLEADDLAGFMVRKFLKQDKDKKIMLVTTDKDWYQFLSPDSNVTVMKRNEVYTYSDLSKELGYPAENIVIDKILKGDSSDNIKGIPRFPTILSHNICSSVHFLNYLDLAHLPDCFFVGKYIKWKDRILEHWDSTILPNAELILGNPKWFEKHRMVLNKPEANLELLSSLYLHRGIETL